MKLVKITSGRVRREKTGEPWPTFDPKPADRAGWSPATITLSATPPRKASALCRDDLCVHVMLDDEGWTITERASGYRLTSAARVFASCDAAMRTAEHLAALYESWPTDARNLSMKAAAALNEAYDAADDRNELLLNLVAVR